MIFLNDKLLSERIKRNELTEQEKFIYFLIQAVMIVVLTSSYLSMIFYSETDFGLWDYLTDIAVFAITIIGSIVCFKTNQEGDGANFIEKFVCLSIPVMVKSLIYTCVLAVIMYFGLFFMDPNLTSRADTPDIFIIIVFYISFFYYRMNILLKAR